MGMTQETKEQIFKPFSRASSVRGREVGTGLGLAVVKSLVESMYGTVNVESELGSGSEFQIAIPTEVVPPQVTLESGPKTSTSTAISPLAGRTALVLLSNTGLAENLKQRLTALDMRVVADNNGQRNGNVEERVDIVFCEPDPEDTMRPLVRSTRVIVDWTGAGGEEETLTGDRIFLRKPIRGHALTSTLCGALGLPEPTHLRKLIPPHKQPITSPLLESARHLKILLADDNILTRKILRKLLLALGCVEGAIYSASNGAEALVSLEQHMVDIVLLDLDMPVMDGFETVREIRRLWPDTKWPFVIAATASATAQTRTACLAAGMDDFITKPIKRTAVVDVIEKVLRMTASAGDQP